MRAHRTMRRGTLLAAGALTCWAPTAAAAPPAPCGGAPQIADAAGDGHHPNTDVVAAWLTESGGRLQAVIDTRVASWAPEHDDSDAAGFALLYEDGATVRYVRAVAGRGAAVAFDHGTWTRAGGFASAGATTGSAGDELVIDVPSVPAATVLRRPFALTYDGGANPGQHWVDRAPGGTDDTGTEAGADFVAGACAAGPGATPPPGTALTTTAVALDAPPRVRGGGPVEVGGRVVPARAGVIVAIAAEGGRTHRAVTQADGTFSLVVPIDRTTRLRAVADGIGSQTRTLVVVPTVRIRIRDGVVTGRVRPALPGRVVILRRGTVKPAARGTTRRGRFSIRLTDPRRGRYQAVVIPSGDRAERAVSNTGVIR